MTHPLLRAVAPLVDRIGATVVDVADATDDDVLLEWEGEPVVAVRLRSAESPPAGDLPALLEAVAEELGGPLHALSRADKQRAVRLLEERGAFNYRKSAETVAAALGVTRFTVYNYLNRARA